MPFMRAYAKFMLANITEIYFVNYVFKNLLYKISKYIIYNKELR